MPHILDMAQSQWTFPLKNLDLHDTNMGPVQLIIGTNNSDLILPKQTEVDRVPYAVEFLLGWAVTNWLPGE